MEEHTPPNEQQDLRAAHSTAVTPAASGELPEWIQLLPAGTFSGVDGRGPYSVPDPAAVIRLTEERSGGNDLPIDYGHALEAEGYAGDAAPAAGWISELEDRSGEIWGRVSWTDEGAAKIRGRSFRFLSPVFYHDASGRVRYLVRAGLTNRPNLRLKAVHTQRAGEQESEPGEEHSAVTSTTTTKKTAHAADGEAGAGGDAGGGSAGVDAALARIAVAVGVSETAAPEEIAAAVEAAVGAGVDANASSAHAREPDPRLYVSRQSYDEVAGELKSAQAREGERLIDEAVASGRLTPAQRKWAKSYHARDAQGFGEFLAAQPVLVSGAAAHAAAGGAGTRELDADAKAVCAALGLSAEEYLKNTTTREEGQG